MNAWQPIEKADRNDQVLAWRAYIGWFVARWNGRAWVTVPGKYSWRPTHWMPLPAGPLDDPQEPAA